MIPRLLGVGGLQLRPSGGSRLIEGSLLPSPRRDCPPLLFDLFRGVAVAMNDLIAIRATIDSSCKRNLISMAATRAIL